MSRIPTLLSAVLLVLASAAAQPQAPASAPAGTTPNVRVRGTITEMDGSLLQLQSREGKSVRVALAENTKVSVLSRLKMSDIKPGRFVGVTAILRGGALQALEVHVFPESMRGTGEGHYDWDLQPGSSMTNANVDAVVATNDGEKLTLSYKGGTQEIVVPRRTPVITFTPTDRSPLKAGAAVFVIAQPGADGSLTAQRILVGSKDLKPPM